MKVNKVIAGVVCVLVIMGLVACGSKGEQLSPLSFDKIYRFR